MQHKTEKRVEDLRNRANAAKAELDGLKTVLAQNKDKYINDLLRQASLWLGDLETYFVTMLQERREPARTEGEEAQILDGAEVPLGLALSLIKSLKSMVNRYGPRVMSTG